MKELDFFRIPPRCSSKAVKEMAAKAGGDYAFICTKETGLRWVNFAQDRMVQIAEDTGAVLTYADHFFEMEGKVVQAPVIDYQEGSLRDDFDFGSVLLVRTSALKEAASGMDEEYEYAGLYDLRLRLSRLGRLEHINEFLYYEVELDTRKSG
ncbi:MAG: glycosyltransferase family 2 protein, partial [Bacteroidales bacterium]|nr:glycosyltransferase family 2 protein [Bacteroidales bacterium]